MERCAGKRPQDNGRLLSLGLFNQEPLSRCEGGLDLQSRRHPQTDGLFRLDSLDGGGQPSRKKLLLHQQRPPGPLAGNTITAGTVTWSVISIIGLLGGTGVIFYFFGRYDWLGWSDELKKINFRSVAEVALTPSQKAVVWFLLVSSLLFLIQTLIGSVIAIFQLSSAVFWLYFLASCY